MNAGNNPKEKKKIKSPYGSFTYLLVLSSEDLPIVIVIFIIEGGIRG